MKIYTKTGDKGQTSLVDGTRVSKASDRVETYGTVDELNSILGICLAQLKTSDTLLRDELTAIQHDLFTIGASLAAPKRTTLPYLAKRITDVEKLIDTLTVSLPPLKHFILPSGGEAGAFLHQARAVCRRTERRIVALANDESVEPRILQYFNRLSDLFFTMARYSNVQQKKQETIWRKPNG